MSRSALVRALVRRLAPHWVRNALSRELAGYERFAPPRLTAQPPGRRVLVLAPHPDDESIACGGSLALYARAGVPVHVAFLTDGRLGDPALRALPAGSPGRRQAEAALAATRRTEALAALAALGLAAEGGASFLEAPDGALAGQAGAVGAQLAAVIARLQPDTVLLPFLTDRHADHVAANRCLLAAAGALGPDWGRDVTCLGYEVWAPLYANLVVDISTTLGDKRRAIACHASQLRHDDYAAAVEGLNRYRAVSSMCPGTHAEAFHRAPWPAYRELCRQLLT